VVLLIFTEISGLEPKFLWHFGILHRRLARQGNLSHQ